MVLCEEYKEYNLLREREKKYASQKYLDRWIGIQFLFFICIYLIILLKKIKTIIMNIYVYIVIKLNKLVLQKNLMQE